MVEGQKESSGTIFLSVPKSSQYIHQCSLLKIIVWGSTLFEHVLYQCSYRRKIKSTSCSLHILLNLPKRLGTVLKTPGL